MLSKGNKELYYLNADMYFYALPFFLKVILFFIPSILFLFLMWYGISLIKQKEGFIGYLIVTISVVSIVMSFFLIFKNKSFGRYFGIDKDGLYFTNLQDNDKWLFVPWINIFHIKKETYYATRTYVVEISLVSNKYEMVHYFRVGGDPFWDESTKKITVAYSRIPFQTKELFAVVQSHQK